MCVKCEKTNDNSDEPSFFSKALIWIIGIPASFMLSAAGYIWENKKRISNWGNGNNADPFEIEVMEMNDSGFKLDCRVSETGRKQSILCDFIGSSDLGNEKKEQNIQSSGGRHSCE